MTDTDVSRRRVLAATGATATISVLAGCGGGGGDGAAGEDGSGDGAGGDDDGEDTPTERDEEETSTETEGEDEGGDGGGGGPEERLMSYLEVDPQARNFEGDVADQTGQDQVTVQVGAGSDGLSFDPAAMRISSGTTVIWEWTGEGGAHNVASTTEADADTGDAQSDFDFYSGEPQDSGTFEQTFDEAGVGLYLCEPHATVGMKGGFVVGK
jgi:halocyanin-like protein